MSTTKNNLEDFDSDEWGNTNLPGLSDEELFNPRINVKLANKQKANEESFRQKMAKVKIGKKRPDMIGKTNPMKIKENRIAKSKAMLGKKKSKSQIENWKIAYDALPKIICPYCNFESKNQGNMNRYHFDNCKHKL